MKHILFVFVLFVSISSFGQELDFSVSVQAPNNTKVDNSIFKKLESEIYNVLNESEWTDLEYQAEERIEGNIQLTITQEVSDGVYKADLIIQASRPVYNSSYSSSLISFVDKNVTFSYDGVSPISKTSEGYINNISSIISFYAYYVLGLDADSFELKGGDKYYQICQDIINNLPGSTQQDDEGWSLQRNDKQNRYFMVENMRSKQLDTYREAIYNYHRKGLDYMYSDNEKARNTILASIQQVGDAHRAYNNSIVTRMFSDAKRNEIIEIFLVANSFQQKQVKTTMLKIDPAQSSLYKRLK